MLSYIKCIVNQFIPHKTIHTDPYQYLKDKGFTVKVRHLRFLPREGCHKYLTKYEFLGQNIGEWNALISKTGGKTTVSLTTPDGKTFNGIAQCSNIDYYSRPDGRNNAIWRALREMTDDEKKKYDVLDLYKSMCIDLGRM